MIIYKTLSLGLYQPRCTSWYKTKETKLREEYIKEFDKIFDHLLDYLKMEIQKEQEEIKRKGWWQLWK
jgi:hypothetical protein